jgi:hypothetical protein
MAFHQIDFSVGCGSFDWPYSYPDQMGFSQRSQLISPAIFLIMVAKPE